MKKLICLMLAVFMVLSMVACGGSKEAEPQAATPSLRVGIGRVDITPAATDGVLLSGGGDPNRHANNVLDYLYVTCIAITDENDVTALIVTQDSVDSNGSHSKATRDSLSQATGVPYDNIFICATHTHSAPSAGADDPNNATWLTSYKKGIVKAAELAMADRSPATVSSGSVEAEGYAFVRRYYLDDGTVQGASGNQSTSTKIVSHVYEANDTVQIVRFTREEEGKRDIIMTNLGVHCTFNGATTKLNISADYPAGIRTYVESEVEDVIVAFFAAAAGDQVGDSDLPERAHGLDYFSYGEKIGEFIVNALPDLKPVETGSVRAAHQVVETGSNHIAPDRKAAADQHWALFQEKGFAVAEAAAKADGFAGIYECMGVRMRSGLKPTQSIPLSVLTVGELSFSFSPYEMYGASAADLVARSPYENTFVISCANGAAGYIPTTLGYELNTYEAYTSKVIPGTAETLVNTFISMLEMLKNS